MRLWIVSEQRVSIYLNYNVYRYKFSWLSEKNIDYSNEWVMKIAMDSRYIDLLRFVQMEFYYILYYIKTGKPVESDKCLVWLLDLSEAWISYQNLNKNNLAFV